MNAEGVMSMFLTVIIMMAGLVALIQAVNHSVGNLRYVASNLLLIDIVTGFLYMLVWVLVGLMYIYSGYDMLVIFAVLGLCVFAVLIMFIRFCIRHWDTSMNKSKTFMFLIYFGMVLYATIFMRIGLSNVGTTVAEKPFDDLTLAIRYREPEMLIHMAENILLFLPFGYLIPEMNPRHLRKWSFALIGGLMASTTIEMIQYVFQLGQSDIDDIIANTLGAVLGYLIVRLVWNLGE